MFIIYTKQRKIKPQYNNQSMNSTYHFHILEGERKKVNMTVTRTNYDSITNNINKITKNKIKKGRPLIIHHKKNINKGKR